MAEVILRARAERDLEAIGDYIARDNPRRAISFVRELRDQGKKLADNPKIGVRIPVLGEAIQRITFNKYLIIYRYDQDKDTVFILRITEGHRDLDQLNIGS